MTPSACEFAAPPPAAEGPPASRLLRFQPAPVPAGAIRTRARDAPAPCKQTPCQENGNIVSVPSPANPIACNDASISTG